MEVNSDIVSESDGSLPFCGSLFQVEEVEKVGRFLVIGLRLFYLT